PVNPPPPSTSAVLSGLGRRRRSIDAGWPTPRAARLRRVRALALSAFMAGSSLTTLPMPETFYAHVTRNGPARFLILLGLSLFGLLAAASPGAAAQLPEIQADLSRQLSLAGPHDGAYVYDV